MAEIPLTHGLIALVDDADFEKVSAFKWHGHRDGNIWYVLANLPRGDGPRKKISLHRFLLGLTDRNTYVDHINGNGLDNRRENLRVVSNQQNQQNVHHLKRGKSSQYKGVCRHRCGKWMAQITVDQKAKYLGLFDREEDAARAYDRAARESFAEFGNPNF